MLKIVIVYMGKGLYKHWALLSDRISGGKPMLISNTLRNGTVREESWDSVVGHRPYKILAVKTLLPAPVILAKARCYIGKARYDLLSYNCEHFVKEMVSGVAKSGQVRQALIITGMAACILCLRSRKR